MSAHAISHKLEELDRFRPDNSELDRSKAQAGAERLAAALTLGKSLTLEAPGQEPDPELAAGAIKPAQILDDWNQAEINALLRRGIFAPSTYGRVRFHHRGTQEYLTALWLHQLIHSGCPLTDVSKILFAERYGIATVIPSMRAAAAWLALWEPSVRNEIVRKEPFVLMQHGDPGSLPAGVKRRLLLEVARKHKDGEIADDSIDNRALWMFASPELADSIREAWALNDRSYFRFDLLRLIREGRIAACADLAFDVVLDATASDAQRIVAIQAISESGDKESLSIVADRLRSGPQIAHARVAAEFAQVLFPHFLSVFELFSLIDRTPPQRRNSPGCFADAIGNLWAACPAQDRGAFIGGLVEICLKEPLVSDFERVSERHAELANHLGSIARDLLVELGNAEPCNDFIRLLAVVERSGRSHYTDKDAQDLSALVASRPKAQRALFWHDVEEMRERGKEVTRHWQVFHGPCKLWAMGPDDISWLREDLEQRLHFNDQRLALHTIACVLRSAGTIGEREAELRALAGDDLVLNTDLDEVLAPPPAASEWEEERRAWEQENRSRQEEDKKSWRRFREGLEADPEQLTNPTLLSSKSGWLPLLYLAEWLKRRTGKDYDAAAIQWQFLRDAFGEHIAESYRTGMCRLWRVTTPERPERRLGSATTVKWTTILSYAAVGIEANSDPEWAKRLTSAEACTATLHGCLSEQGYPAWIETLLAVHRDVVRPILRDEFIREWNSDKELPNHFSYHYVSDGILDADVRHDVITTICQNEPSELSTLDRGLRILGRIELTPDERTEFERVALARFCACPQTSEDRAIRYIALMFLSNPKLAHEQLANWLNRATCESSKSRAEQAMAILFGMHDPLVRVSLSQTPVAVLENLLTLAYATVKPNEDNVHDGSYTPDTRDDAESGRSAVLKALIDTPGPESFAAMMRLSERPDFKDREVRFRELARGMAERDTEPPGWNPLEFLNFQRRYVRPVKSGEDLHEVVLDVINEIAWSFDNSDASSRQVLSAATSEDAVQEWLAEQLRLRSRERYHVHRESEVAEGNLPDIIVSAIAADWEVAIEVKHGGMRWTARELEEAIRRQLAEKYLRPLNRRHGVFIVTRHCKKRWRNPFGGKLFEFDDLIEYLSAGIGAVTDNDTGPLTLSVRGIDAAPRAESR